MNGTTSPSNVSTKLAWIAELARHAPPKVLTTLAHHVDADFLREAWRRTRRDGAVGVDGQTAEDYGSDLEGNLEKLLNAFKSGRYLAPPVRRVEIPKGDGKTRPIGIPSIEDKLLQRAVAMLLEPVYEQDFHDCSYGFRPGRSAHDALQVLWQGLMDLGGGWVLDVDIKSFFDTIDHGHLRSFLDQRVRDGVVRRAIDKWLAAGVMKDGSVSYPSEGTPQGGVISPLLANIYLHVVLDEWFAKDVRPRLKGRAFLVRYADDFVMGFEREDDARRVLAVLPRRFGKYGLTLHPEKTRLLNFEAPGRRDARGPRDGPGSFDFLGLNHHWGKSRKGRWVVQRKTASKRLTRAVAAMRDWCRAHRHAPLVEQHRGIVVRLRGHANYYGIRGNSRALACFWQLVRRLWKASLSSRSDSGRLNYAAYDRVLERFPLPRLHLRPSP